MGQFHLYAKIYEEAGAYAMYDINVQFPTIMPEEYQYYDYDVLSKVRHHQSMGNQQRTQQILTAQASIIREACYFNMTCKDPSWNPDLASAGQRETYNQMLRNITNANYEALLAGNTLHYTNMDQMLQGSALLSAITDNSEAGGDTTIDMAGRDEAVTMIGVSARSSYHDGKKKYPRLDNFRNLPPALETLPIPMPTRLMTLSREFSRPQCRFAE